ncbi:MAG: hypothetical protein JNK73_13195 [Bacteroidia bacterium]|nr:hypothetical protein [Bacteroidia bacterium]
MFKGPVINKSSGGLGAKSATEQNVFGLVCGGVLPGSGTYTVLGTSVKLIQKEDADTLGFTAAYDAANKVLIRYHIDEFFTINPNGTLWLMVVAQTVTLTQMCTYANAYVTKLINDSGKKVKFVGVVRNPATGYTPTLTDGLDNDVNTAVPLAQLLVEAFIPLNCYIDHILVEGREVNGVISSIKDLRTLDSENVHVCILQDKDVAALDALYAKHAAVGTVMGMVGVRQIEEDYGSINTVNNPNKAVENFKLNDGSGRWNNPAISSGTLVSSLTPAEITVLQDRGFIFADSYPEYDGVYLNSSAACTAIDSDFAFGVRMRVWNAGARLVVKRFIPKYNSKFATDDDGKISPTVIAEWQEDVKNPRNGLGVLVRDDHAQEVDCFIDPNQIPDANQAEILIGMSIKVFNYVRKITGTLKLTVK